MLKWYVYIIISMLLVKQSYSQERKRADFKLWKLISYNGSIGARGFYRTQERTLNNILDESKFPFLYGAFSLYTTSYIGHPQLLKLDVGGEYNPGLSRQTYTVSPDRSEVLTFKKLNIRATLFEGKPMSFGGHIYFNQDFINREYVTSLETKTKEWGLNYFFRNKYIPISASFVDRDWKQRELETGRTFLNRQKDFQISSRRSFTKYGDRNEIKYTRFEYFRVDNNKDTTYNLYNNFYLNNTFYFDRDRKYVFRSSITNLDQRGNINQARFQMLESLNVKLPLKFTLTGNYNYTNVAQVFQKYNQHRLRAGLNHKLFSSLETNIDYDVFITNHTAYQEKNARSGISFKYRKKIPTGNLSLFYSYRKHTQGVLSNPNSIVQIIDEFHILADGQIELLNLQYPIASTVVVKDLTGVVIYQVNFDYILIDRGGGFLEVQRLPGGQIPNSGSVNIDYQATQVGSYKFDSNSWIFSVNLTLFKRLLELYYTRSNQDYNNIESEDILTLNYYKQNVFGGRVMLGPFTGGAEWDMYNSTIVPYRKTRYFVNVNGTVGKKFLLSFNGDVTNLTLTETNEDQFYSSLYGKVVFMIKPQTKINFDLGYRKQLGQGIDLDLFTSKLEYNMVYRKLLLKIGLEVYKRNYVGEQLNFRGVYFQIDRRF